MKNWKKCAVVMAAVMMLASFGSCGDKKESSSSVKDDSSSSAIDSSSAAVESASEEAPDFEADFAGAVEGESGVQYSYDEATISPELVKTLDTYFTSIANKDYETYSSVIQPDFLTAYENFLLNNESYGYPYEESFNTLCKSCTDSLGGDFTVKRIKVVMPDSNSSETYIGQLATQLGDDLLSNIQSNSDNVFDVMFYVSVECNGEELYLAKNQIIVTTEKDGKYFIVA